MAERLTGKDIRNTTILKVDKDNMHIYNTTTEDGEEETVISCDAITKLGELEDILEKYSFGSVEELSNALEFAKVIEQTLSGYGINDNEELECVLEKSPKFVVNDNAEKRGQEINGVFFSNEQILILSQYNELQEPYKKRYEQVKTDRDTWKRACELASSHISWCPAKQGECNCTEEKRDYTNFFYQQAKKEKQL